MMYQNSMGALAMICSLSYVVQVFGIENTSDATKKVMYDDSALRHKIINDYNVDHASDHVVTAEMVERVKARSAEITAKREVGKLRQQEIIRSKRLQKTLEENTVTAEPVEKQPTLSAKENRVIAQQQKEERVQRNRSLSKEERIQKAQAILATATAMQNELDKKAALQGVDKNEKIKKAQAMLAKAAAAQKELDERAQACGIDKNERIKKAQAILAEATRIHNELYN